MWRVFLIIVGKLLRVNQVPLLVDNVDNPGSSL